ncbi:uncharacterized protein LOC111045282 isoform X2 [Nilaparvata lugens]|nr:uncharacterized protein LOC111045282 isoform X2 [Nilaparvata lugens]XP_039284628.1 uncharacterized protein LOC111045282 isoform X2 [Nilaparvata lugens]XP_039284629.1 uncharacterized protein LOC111045282 isoform X2 [Nilaparvata lugens]
MSATTVLCSDGETLDESFTPLSEMTYNPFSDYMLTLGIYYEASILHELPQKALKSQLISDLFPVNVLKTDKYFNWEFTVVVGVETGIAGHLNKFPSHRPLFEHAVGLWRQQNRNAILGVEQVANSKTGTADPTTECVYSVAKQVLEATLAERNVKLDEDEVQKLITVINQKFSLEYLYTVLPVYKRMLFAKMASYFESGQLDDLFANLQDDDY